MSLTRCRLPDDIWYMIAGYVEPSPPTFVKLAGVSRFFYQTFTSDALWRQLDVNGVGEHIYQNFTTVSSQTDLEAMGLLWSSYGDTHLSIEYDLFTNPYLYLGYLLCTPANASNEPELINNKNLLLCALQLDDGGYFIDQVSQGMLEDRDLARAAMGIRGCMLENFSHFNDDKEIVLLGVTTGCPDEDTPLQWASERLQDDFDVVMAAVSQYGYSLECASDRLRSNRDIIEAAIKRDGPAIESALFLDQELVLLAVGLSQYSLECVPEEYQDNEEVVLKSIESGWESIYNASPRLRTEPKILKRMLDLYPNLLECSKDVESLCPDVWKALQALQ